MPTDNFVIVAAFRAKQDKVDALRETLLALVAPTRAEQGCMQYDLHQDLIDPTEMLFYEIWESREAWDAHMASPHLTALPAKLDGLLESPLKVWQFEQIEP